MSPAPPPSVRRTALLTGASAGIGVAFADVFAAHGYDLVLTARRAERLRETAEVLAERHGVRTHVLPEDLADPATPVRLMDAIAARGLTVDALVNNAGFGVPGTYTGTSWEDQQRFLQVLVTAVCHLTHLALPGMRSRGFGRVIQVASLAGFMPGSAVNTLYGAAKAFVIKMAEALAQEMEGTGVHVTAVCPGFTHSEFHDVIGTRQKVAELPRFLWMDAPTVARCGYQAVERGQPVVITGAVNGVLALASRLLPQRVARRLVQRNSHRFRRLD